mmetsp:Transcript_118816/g.318792  ORF Transcript_118816/g.318792 Transcript_118816/m.318792 type:complete len:288 (-) Transcript_118816:94-957(-)
MSANTADWTDPDEALDLNNIRRSLQRMEDSIIFSLIERSQYRVNRAVYQPNYQKLSKFHLHQLRMSGSDGSLGDWFIYQTECLHAQVRRYSHPTEFAFFGPLPEPTLGAGEPEAKAPILAPVPREAVINGRLLEIYRQSIVPTLCEEGDDGNYGSTSVQDVHCLQTMATRIYFGLFVAESKFRSERETATALIKARDRDGLMAFITKPEVERKNVQRVVLKARTFSQTIASAEGGQQVPDSSSQTSYKVNPEFVGRVFEEWIMPLTKDVEVEYLLARLDGEPSAESR